MIEINLLPKEYQKRKFKLTLEKNTIFVIGVGVAALILLMAYSYLFQVMPIDKISKNIIAYQQEESKFDPQIAKIDSLNNLKERIITRMSAIDILDRDRGTWIDICSDLGSRVSDYLWITEFKQLIAESAPAIKPASVDESSEAKPTPKQAVPQVVSNVRRGTIKGQSFSLNSIATFIIKLKKSPYFDNIELTSIKLVEVQNAEAYEFVINSNLIFNRTEKTTTENVALAGNVGAGSQFYSYRLARSLVLWRDVWILKTPKTKY
jgi:Tfp pilus assembly protein PilN